MLVLSLVGTALGSGGARGGGAPLPIGSDLSLAEALDLASRGNPSVAVARLTEDQAAAAVLSAASAYDPVLSGSAGRSVTGSPEIGGVDADPVVETSGSASLSVLAPTGTRLWVDGTLGTGATTPYAGSAAVTVAQDLLAPLRSSPDRVATRTAAERRDQAGIATRSTWESAVRDVATAWWAWWSATDAARLAEDEVALARALEDRTRAQRAEGEIAQLELDRVTADRLGAERDLVEARAEVARDADALLVLVGEAPGTPIVPAGDGRAWIAPVGRLDALLAVARDHNVDVAAAAAELGSAEAAGRDARDAVLPTLDLTGSLGVLGLSDTAADAVRDLSGDDGLQTASIALDLGVPLGSRAARAERQDAAAVVAIAEVQLRTARARVEADVRDAVATLDAARQGAALSEARVAVARSTEDGEQARVDEGAARLDQLLDARHARASAEAELRTAQIAVWRAELQLALLLGGSEGRSDG